MPKYIDEQSVLTGTRRDIVLAMAEHDMNLLAVARAMYFHRNNVKYHCSQIYRITGLNPRRFYDLVKLVEMVKEDNDG